MERKEAIEIVRSNFPNGRIQLSEALETLIPELKESEDEKIAKELIRYLPYCDDIAKDTKEGWIAWLERIGEGIPSKETVLNVWDLGNIWKELTNGASNTEYGTQLEYIIKHWKEGERYVKEADGWKEGDVIKYGDSVVALVIEGRMAVKSNGEVFTVQYPDEWVKVMPDERKRFLDKLESQCGRLKWKEERGKKPADNPKFKIGDWVIGEGFNPILITDIKNNRYEFEFIDGTKRFSGIDCIDSDFNLWTVEDAEDGDVLVDEDNNIGIYKENDDLNWSSYIYLGCDNRLRGFSIGGYHNCKSTKPATLEQRELLFSKMDDAGYEWDAEKKELNINKVEKKHSDDEGGVRFKIGDWIVCDGIDSAAKITGIDADSYEAEFFDGSTRFSDIGFVDRNFRPWTVEDAKDGDVLAFYYKHKGNKMEQVGIIEKYVGRHGGCSNSFSIYAGVDWENNLQMGGYMGSPDIQPATLKQREFLFSKIREAKYEWDAENKSFRQLL